MPKHLKKRNWLTILCLLLAMFVFLIFISAGISLSLYIYMVRDAVPGEQVEITIPKGSTARNVATILKENNLIPHEIFFLIFLKLKGEDKNIKYGIYSIPNGVSIRQIYELIKKGPVRPIYVYKITVPEGLTNKQIADITPNPEEFLNLVNSSEYAKEKGIPGPTVEGFLMPGTYMFEEVPSMRELADAMMKQFNKNWDKLCEEYKINVSEEERYKTIIIASLVEEESKIDDERPLIAQVIYNRLKKGMLLQIDATLQYANQKYGELLTEQDKLIDSPYNTYKYKGLPPTPICNPGIQSIRAVISPTDGDYLYFVSNGDNRTHTFSKTIDEHITAVKNYKKELKNNNSSNVDNKGQK